jgi:selenocysteine lyase/cysteine desulfurase
MEMLAAWGTGSITERLGMLTGLLAEGLPGDRVTVPPEHLRAPHILSLSFPDGVPRALTERLAAENVFVSQRLGRLRISPHVYNDEEDMERFIRTFRKLVA